MSHTLVFAAAFAMSLAAAPRYVNPLSIEDTRSIADPTVLRFQGSYYLFLSGGAVWTSDDLVHWTHKPLTMPAGHRQVVAPNAFEYRGKIYLSGNDAGLYRAPSPLGPWEYAGDIHDEQGKKMLLFDSMDFVDTDGKLYMYYSGRHADGIWGVQMDANDPTRFATAPKKLFTYDPRHVWERYGDNNEGTALSWIEAPWMTKRNGRYYLQYSAPGTEWKTYAVGVYTSAHPLGPFTYAPRNPILVHHQGLINGVGHHTIVEGPDRNLWAIYTVLYRNHNVFDRRIGLDPVRFDKDGNMFVDGPSEEPARSIAVSINRYSWSASSAKPGRDPMYAFDNNVRTWWEPAADDEQPSLTLDLGCRNSDDANQEFVIDSTRLLFDAAPERNSLTVDGHARSTWKNWPALAYQYKIEGSLDNETFFPIVDKQSNARKNNVEFDEFRPVRCRWVRFTLTKRPPGQSTALLEFTVFGGAAQ